MVVLPASCALLFEALTSGECAFKCTTAADLCDTSRPNPLHALRRQQAAAAMSLLPLHAGSSDASRPDGRPSSSVAAVTPDPAAAAGNGTFLLMLLCVIGFLVRSRSSLPPGPPSLLFPQPR